MRDSKYQWVNATGEKRIRRLLKKKQSVICGVKKLKLNEEYCKVEIMRMSTPFALPVHLVKDMVATS